MDPNMDCFLNYEKFGPPFARRDVPEETLAKFQGKLPKQLLQYWREYGWCGYGEGLFWTVDPDEWAEHIAEWLERTTFFARDTYHVIGRTAFGKLYCRIPSDHIPIRSWPLFLARELMRDLIETLKAEQST